MSIRAICLGTAIALFLSGGIAFAGTLGEPETMKPFFTDASMKTMKPMKEFKKVFMAMPAEKQEAMKNECAGMTQPYTAFCANVNTLGGHN